VVAPRRLYVNGEGQRWTFCTPPPPPPSSSSVIYGAPVTKLKIEHRCITEFKFVLIATTIDDSDDINSYANIPICFLELCPF